MASPDTPPRPALKVWMLDVVKKLGNNSTTFVELYSIISTFKQKLAQRKDDQFYGYLTKVKLQHLLSHDADRAEADLTAFLNTESYIEKWFDFSEDNWLFSLQPLSLNHGKLSFSDTERIINKLNLIQKVSMANKWSDSRNRCSVELIRSELLITFNFEQSC
ncbi:uncharacterized protein LOC113746684 [Tachysurus ichikawai]